MSFWQANIGDMINNHLRLLNDRDEYFMSSVQTGKWIVDADHDELNVTPTREQFLYNINVDLLYGAKGIEMNDYYYFLNGDLTKRTSLFGVYPDNLNDTTTVRTQLWYTLKNEVSPKLKGSYGKLLKKLTETSQGYLNSTTNQKDTLNIRIIKEAGYEYDYGFFDNNTTGNEDKKYIMLASRFYNPDSPEDEEYNMVSLRYGQLSYKNWKIKNHYKGTTFYNCLSSGYLYIYDTIEKGEAALLEIMPAIKYGGQIGTDENITHNTLLTENLQINANKKIYINDSCTYTISKTITVKSGASINRIGCGNINFTGGGKIINEVWSNSLFFTVENTHPKLIWGYQTGPKTYYVYKYNGGTWALIGTVSISAGDTTHKQFFVDTDEIVSSGTYTMRYKVLQGTTYTNEVSIPIFPKENVENEKNTLIKEFGIEQNYPNPFNGTTHIKYILPANGKVSIKLYDILGKEVKNIFEGMQEQGIYEININCDNLASGMYIYRVRYNDKTQSKKMLLMK